MFAFLMHGTVMVVLVVTPGEMMKCLIHMAVISVYEFPHWIH